MYKVKVENLKQFEVVLNSDNVGEIILSRDSFAESILASLVSKIKKSGKLAWILMERISRYEENMKIIGTNANKSNTMSLDLRTSTDKIYDIEDLDGIIIQNLDSFAYMLRRINKAANKKLMVELNYTMNCYNRETKLVHEFLYNDKRNNAKDLPLLFTAPLELNTYELSDVGYDTIIIYSYIDTMVSANCLKKNTSITNVQFANEKSKSASMNLLKEFRSKKIEPICNHKFDFNNVKDFSSYIIDRKGEKLHYKTYCKYCYNKIFNTTPLYLLDKLDELKDMYNKYLVDDKKTLKYRMDFSFENENEVKNILSMKKPSEFTRGHFKTSIK